MTNPSAPILDRTNAKRYKANPEFNKHAVLTWAPADYKLSWGEQSMKGPHMVVTGDTDKYGCALEEFFTTHKPVLGQEDHWYKDVEVLALQVTEPTDIVTTMEDGSVEARSTVPAGAWIVRNPAGEQYYNKPKEFAERYIPSSED